MKKMQVVAYIQISNRAYRDKVVSNAIFLFNQQGFQSQGGASGELQNSFAPLGYYAQPIYKVRVALKVPNNYSISAIRSIAFKIFSRLGKVVSVNAQLGEVVNENITAENKTNSENDIEVLEETEDESSENSWLWALGGFALGWIVTRK